MDRHERHVTRNLIALGIDFASFAVGLSFYDPFTIIPAFVQELTGSELMVGLMAAVRVLMVTLPQLLSASLLNAVPRKKPVLVWSSVLGRLPVLLLALITLRYAHDRPWLVIGMLALSFACFFASEGFNYISWPDLVGKVIPSRIRGRFLGYGQLASSVGGVLVGIAVGAVLGAPGLDLGRRWALLFACAAGGFALSIVGMLLVREEPAPPSAEGVRLGRSLRIMAGHLRRDGRLRLLVLIQVALLTAAAVFPFYVVRARQLVAARDGIIGLFLIMQNAGAMAAAVTCGQLIDRVGSKAAICVSNVAQVLSLAAATFGPLVLPAQHAFFLAFVGLGFFAGSSWWSFTAYLLEMAEPSERPMYLAANGILTGPTFVGSIVVGAVYASVNPTHLMAAALALATLGLALSLLLPHVGPARDDRAAAT